MENFGTDGNVGAFSKRTSSKINVCSGGGRVLGRALGACMVIWTIAESGGFLCFEGLIWKNGSIVLATTFKELMGLRNQLLVEAEL